MANLKTLFLICGVLAGVYGADKAVNIDPEPSHIPPEPTTPATNSTTALPPTTSTTPTKPSTTSITTSSTTSITTTSSTSTTSLPTTTKTTSSPTKPTPTPTPVDPKVANWTVNYANSSRSCIVLSMAAQFEIPHPKLNKTTINLPIDANATGSCEDLKEEKLIISWGVNNSLEFNFLKSNTSKFDLDSIVAKLNTSEAGVIVLSHKKAEFSTPLENSYKCTKPQALNLTEPNSNSTAAYLTISHLQYQAFRNSTEHKFDSALDCEGGSVTTDVVPIVVGCVLAVLVVAVLVAYLFGRRRCQARGYLSM